MDNDTILSASFLLKCLFVCLYHATLSQLNRDLQSYTHSVTEDFMGDWAPATPTGLNTTEDYQPDGLVVWPCVARGLGRSAGPRPRLRLQAVCRPTPVVAEEQP